MSSSGRIYWRSGSSPVIADDRMSAGQVILMTSLDSWRSKSPPKYPSLPATKPTTTRANNVSITTIIAFLFSNSATKVLIFPDITKQSFNDS